MAARRIRGGVLGNRYPTCCYSPQLFIVLLWMGYRQTSTGLQKSQVLASFYTICSKLILTVY